MATFAEKAKQLVPLLEKHSAAHDQAGTFVSEAFQALKDEKLFALAVPAAFGGGGGTYRELCEVIRVLAQGCTSTALAFSMHQHLVAATVWRVKHGQPGEPLLRKVAEQGMVLISTGASDWLESNGKMEKVDKGFRFTAHKPFCSGSPAGDLLVTSGRYEDPKEGKQILHFVLPIRSEGVRSLGDWDTLGMRGTGSNTLAIEGAFVPDEAITIRRPAGPWFPALNVVATVACPIIMSAYLGAAEKATELAIARAKHTAQDPDVQNATGELLNELFTAQALWAAAVDNVNEFDFAPELERASRAVQAKSMLADAVQRTTRKAMEVGGGGAYFKKATIERLLRDVHGSTYHPLQVKRQIRFSGRIALGLPPI